MTRKILAACQNVICSLKSRKITSRAFIARSPALPRKQPCPKSS